MPDSDCAAPMIYDDRPMVRCRACVFETLSGRPLGSLIRYCAHPCIAGIPVQGGTVRISPALFGESFRRSSVDAARFSRAPAAILHPGNKAIGTDSGLSVVLFAPVCRGWHIVIPRHAGRRSNASGAELPSQFSQHLRQRDTAPLTYFSQVVDHVVLRVRTDLMANPQEAAERARTLHQDLLSCRQHLAMPDLKRKMDELYFLSSHAAIYDEYHYLTQRDWQKKTISTRGHRLRLNDIVLVGLPGEVFCRRPSLPSRLLRRRDST